ncbi:histidine phosphatase family protein [Chitinophaga vietnamensis]|uniref:histidine phosphatase family protein n=1 Tax=Chitinophaga vietnamensis TaxID=2593957 RepID=UPI00117791AB|nr:histidine phosphatase family protein [Chitinophaga vietnamensis]
MLKTAILSVLLLAGIRAFAAEPETTIIFVNAAETEATPSPDPGLSTEGQQEAAALTSALRDIPVDAIYTIFQNRGVQTVTPLSTAKNCHLEYYRPAPDAEALEAMMGSLVKQNAGKTIVICGDPENIPAMLRQLGVKAKDLKTLYDKGYGQGLVVKVSGRNTVVAQKLNMNIQKNV